VNANSSIDSSFFKGGFKHLLGTTNTALFAKMAFKQVLLGPVFLK